MMKNSLIWQVMKQTLDRWEDKNRIRHFRIHGLKSGSHVIIRERSSGEVIESGKADNGLFISMPAVPVRPGERYDITIRCPLYNSVVIHDAGDHTIEVEQFRDMTH